MTMGFRIDREAQGLVARLVLERPPGNTLDEAVITALEREIRELFGSTRRPRCLVMQSAVAGQFCQGIDPGAVLKTDLAGRKRIFLQLARLARTIWLGGVPVIADVSGPALAGGAVLASLADFIVMDAAKGKVCWSETKVGLPLPRFCQLLAARKLPPAAWSEALLLARNLDATEAKRLGLACAVYESAEARREIVETLVAKVVRLSPRALSETLRQARRDDASWFDRFPDEADDFAEFLTDAALAPGLGRLAAGVAPGPW